MAIIFPETYRFFRPIGYCRFELNVWVWRSLLGLISGGRLFLTFWKVTRTVFRRTGCLQKNTFLLRILGKNSKNCVSLSNCVISNPLEQKKLDIASFQKVLKTLRFKPIFGSPKKKLKNDFSGGLNIAFLPLLFHWKNCFFN